MENNLQVFNHQEKLVVDSRQVAETIDKQHAHLMRDIKNYCNILNESKFGLVEFFIESTYKDSKGEVRPCYLLTKKGCDMVANKMTGEKGVLFTATYIDGFYEMEKEIKSTNIKNSISPNLKEKEVEAKLNNSRVRMAQTWLKIGTLTGIQEYKEIANTYAANTLANKDILQLPKAQRKTYSATDIGKMFGVSSSMIGKTANANNLKTPEYGQLFYDKSRHSCKEVETWRYYDSVIPVFAKLLKMGVVA